MAAGGGGSTILTYRKKSYDSKTLKTILDTDFNYVNQRLTSVISYLQTVQFIVKAVKDYVKEKIPEEDIISIKAINTVLGILPLLEDTSCFFIDVDYGVTLCEQYIDEMRSRVSEQYCNTWLKDVVNDSLGPGLRFIDPAFVFPTPPKTPQTGSSASPSSGGERSVRGSGGSQDSHGNPQLPESHRANNSGIVNQKQQPLPQKQPALQQSQPIPINKETPSITSIPQVSKNTTGLPIPKNTVGLPSPGLLPTPVNAPKYANELPYPVPGCPKTRDMYHTCSDDCRKSSGCVPPSSKKVKSKKPANNVQEIGSSCYPPLEEPLCGRRINESSNPPKQDSSPMSICNEENFKFTISLKMPSLPNCPPSPPKNPNPLPGCPNKVNPYHICSHYCIQNDGKPIPTKDSESEDKNPSKELPICKQELEEVPWDDEEKQDIKKNSKDDKQLPMPKEHGEKNFALISKEPAALIPSSLSHSSKTVRAPRSSPLAPSTTSSYRTTATSSSGIPSPPKFSLQSTKLAMPVIQEDGDPFSEEKLNEPTKRAPNRPGRRSSTGSREATKLQSELQVNTTQPCRGDKGVSNPIITAGPTAAAPVPSSSPTPSTSRQTVPPPSPIKLNDHGIYVDCRPIALSPAQWDKWLKENAVTPPFEVPIKVELCSYVAPDDFYIHHDLQAVKEMQNLIQFKCAMMKKLGLRLEERQIAYPTVCCALFSDRNWYRAMIERVLPGDMVQVYYIDYGNKETIHFNDLLPLDESLTQFPVQAMWAKLKEWKEKKFKNSPKNRTFMQIVHNSWELRAKIYEPIDVEESEFRTKFHFRVDIFEGMYQEDLFKKLFCSYG